jgi:hypothetical protein
VWTYIDDLKALREKLICLNWEMVPDTVLRGAVGLIYMNSLSWAAELDGSVANVGGCAADCVVKDENLSRSSTAERH